MSLAIHRQFTVLNMKRLFPVFAIGALFLFMCLFSCSNDQTNDDSPDNLTTQEAVDEGVRLEWPKCKPNMSAASVSGFSSLAAHIQQFMYYRHCRHFPMLLDLPNKCGGPGKSAQVFLLLVIKSSPEHFVRRQVLRKTWASERQHKGLWIRRIFISGTMPSGADKARLNDLLKAEQKVNQDILQWDFEESFFNLTLKQILFFQWMKQRCPNARFLLNGDDDVFANTDAMVEYLRDIPDHSGRSHLFTGYVFRNAGPVRSFESKYFVPAQIMDVGVYPPYCGGGGFLLSGHTAMVIHNMSLSTEAFPIDDVYIGMCLEKAGLSPTFHMGVRTLGLKRYHPKLDEQDPCLIKGMLLVHKFLPRQIYLLWHSINDPNQRCGKSPH